MCCFTPLKHGGRFGKSMLSEALNIESAVSHSKFKLVVLGFPYKAHVNAPSSSIRSPQTSQMSPNLLKSGANHGILYNFFKHL